MAISTANQVRLRIQDVPTIADATYAGDGTATQFATPQRNLTTASAYVPQGATAWSATGATFDPTAGGVAFSNVISANSAFRLRYTHSVFSDEEIDLMITAGGGVLGASIEAVQTLMFDSLKRAFWRAPDGTQYDDTAAQQALRQMYDVLQDQQAQQAAGEGGIAEWGLNQQNY